jgi:hypothetical protein
MCDESGVTREHVPPRSFFPPGFRTNLWSVRSCASHNNDNSEAVEYVGIAVLFSIETNGEAHKESIERAIRAFQRNSRLFNRMFQNKIDIDEQRFGFQIDLSMFNQVIKAMAYAIYYRRFNKRFLGDWGIFMPSTNTPLSIFGRVDDWSRYRTTIRQLQFTDLRHPESEVFKCGIHQWSETELAFRFEFYQGFAITALAIPETK